uniref:Uncharacterized protein n=1 Tax=Avena sativa TaxID=4498 RepID=A0ACD5V6V8_AVESA
MPCLIVADSHFSPPSRILDPRKKGTFGSPWRRSAVRGTSWSGSAPTSPPPASSAASMTPPTLSAPPLSPEPGADSVSNSLPPLRWLSIVHAIAVFLSSPIYAVIENNLSKSLCVRLCPEVATIAATAAVAISLPSAPAPESDSERDYRIYSNVVRALVSNSGDRSVGCVLRCVGASSTDNFPFETMVHTLDEHELVNFRPSYWSSCGADDPEEPESLTYRLNSDVCIVDDIRVQPFLAYFQYGQPIYSSKTVRFRMGHYKLPRGSESFVTNEDENKMVNADNKYMWTYTSPEFPMLQENVLQSFKLPCPVLCIGGVVMIELLGRVQKQEADNKYYICICHVEVIGRSLFTTFHG